jgi:hypothetical protein
VAWKRIVNASPIIFLTCLGLMLDGGLRVSAFSETNPPFETHGPKTRLTTDGTNWHGWGAATPTVVYERLRGVDVHSNSQGVVRDFGHVTPADADCCWQFQDG